MEEPICQTSSIETTAEVLGLNADKQGIFDLQNITPAQQLISQTNITEKTGEVVNGCTNEPESPKATEKISSPTLIESAFKVMKNLFSPDKSKSKPTNIMSPMNKPKSASGSPRNSIFIRGKSELLSMDSDTEIHRCGQSAPGENYFKNHILNNEPTQSPVSPFNTTDNSFLTTVSTMNDESFHSAVTDLYDHGDAFKTGNILDDALNNSQNLDTYNDTLKNNDSCLENTTLKVNSFVSEGSKECDIDETDNLNRREVCKNELQIPQKNIGLMEIKNEVVESDNINSPKALNSTTVLYSSERTGNEQIPDIFLSKTSNKDEKMENYKKIESECPKSMQELTAGRSLSSTTVILSSADSVELDNMLTSIKTDDASSLTSFDGCDIASSLENLHAQTDSISLNSLASVSDCLVAKEKKSSVSEGNSPNKPDCNKLKLNKSDELLNCRNSGQSPELKNLNEEKQNADFFANESKTDAVSNFLVSQQSYTILTTQNNSLNRPVIDSLDGSGVLETSNLSTKSNSNGEQPIKAYIKQSTPVNEGNKENKQKSRPKSLKLYSPKLTLQKKMFPSADAEFSPIETENISNTHTVLQEHNEFNQTFDKKTPKKKIECDLKSNRTPDKKIKSPLKQNLKKEGTPEPANRTFSKKDTDKTFTKNQGNLTFDILDSAQLNTTYNTQSMNNNTFFVAPPSQNITFVKDSDVLSNTITQIPADKTDVFVKETDLNGESQQSQISDGNKNTKADAGVSSSGGFALPENLEYRGMKMEISGCKDVNESFISTRSSNASLTGNDLSTVMLHEELRGNESIDDLSGKLEQMNLSDNAKEIINSRLNTCSPFLPEDGQGEEKLLNSLKEDPDLVQLIQEQFSSKDIEKICSVVHDLSSMKLSTDILKASEQFDKSFHGNNSDFKMPEGNGNAEKPFDPLSPQSFEFLSSIQGKPTGRDLSRESLYVKFDPLVQPSANSLIDFTKEGEALAPIDESPVRTHNTSICEQLLTISPQKQTEDIVPPLTPLSKKTVMDNSERLKELQNEIYFLKNLYAEREKANKAKMEDYENQIAKLTGESVMLEDKLKSSNEREKSLVKKVKEQTQNINELKIIMEEYVKVISKLSEELKTMKSENTKQIEALTHEKDSYMTHLQNTEAAFADVHAKYEKSKKTILSLKANETMFRNTIAEQEQQLENFKARARDAQGKALSGFQKLQEELEDTKASHSQETARLRAQLRKTELKVEALQESLDQKMKENQQLTAICDELIEGRK